MDYIERGHALIATHPQARTIRAEDSGQVFWVKRRVDSKRTFWHSVQRLLACVFRAPILRVTAIGDGAAALHGEAARLRAFRDRGFLVPEVLAEDDEALVLSDIGPSIPDCLRHTADPQARETILQRAAAGLAQLHKSGLVHGRPYLRDMTWRDGHVGFLDLEEATEGKIPFASAQARDIWIFLCSAVRFARRPDTSNDYDTDLVCRLYTAYARELGAHPPTELFSFIRRLARPSRFIKRFLWRSRLISRDVHQAVIATQCLLFFLQ